MTLLKSEKEYKEYLELNFFPKFFDDGWKVVIGETKEKRIRRDSKRSRIDYFGFREKIPTYVEVKPERIRQKYLLQIVRYYCDCNEEHNIHHIYRPLYNINDFRLFVICKTGIRPHREKILHNLGIELLDLKELVVE